MTAMYHITTTANAEGLLRSGADRARAGSEGGAQAGWFFYLSPDSPSADYWEHVIGRPGDCVRLAVTLPATARIAGEETVRDASARMVAWATARGHILDRYFAPALLAGLGLREDDLDAIAEEGLIWHLTGMLLAEEGYDGMETQPNTVVVLNWSLLTADTFAPVRKLAEVD